MVVDTGYAGINHSNYWMPIHYDTVENGENKKSHLLFSFLVRIVLFLHFIGGIYLSNNYIITSFHWLHLNNYIPYENRYFNPRKPQSSHGVRHARKFRLRTDALHNTRCSGVLNTQLPRVIDERTIHHGLVCGRNFGKNQ